MPTSEWLEIELPPDLAAYVHARAEDGFSTDGDVVRDLVREAAQRDQFHDEIRRKIAAGVASLRAGKGADGETFMAALDAELADGERHGR